jgi:hypothetical protein
MRLLAAILRSGRGRFLIGVALAWVGFQVWERAVAPSKISPDLSGSSAKVNVQIQLPFKPERFHVLAFQKYGRVSGTDDTSIELRGVRRSDLNAVARPYWVTAIEPIKPGG